MQAAASVNENAGTWRAVNGDMMLGWNRAMDVSIAQQLKQASVA